jgi:adenosylmethionine-8-amino-7-oxononanoate aminotransferase
MPASHQSTVFGQQSEHRQGEHAEQARIRDDQYVWHPWSPISGPSGRIMAAQASGHLMRDVDGTEYIDASALNATCGYAHPALVEAVSRQVGRLHGVDLSVHDHEVAGLLAERLAASLPEGLSRVLFTNSGSEGIEASCFIAASYWAHRGTPRTRVVTFDRGYHGSTTLARSLSGLPPTAHGFTRPLRVTPVALPTPDRVVRDPASTPELLAAFAAAIGEDPDDLPMAVLVEPLINVGGGVVLPPGLLRGLRELCDSRGVLLIIDEIFTGIGRTGRMFGFQHEGIAPDIVVSSKGLSGGYAPIAAVAVQERVYRTFEDDPFLGGLRYGHTTSGHAVACAAGVATLDVVEREGLVARSRELGARLLDGLTPLAGEHGVRDVRGLGMLAILELAGSASATALVQTARRHHLLLRQQGAVVMVVPPLTIDAGVVDDVVTRVSAAIDENGSR